MAVAEAELNDAEALLNKKKGELKKVMDLLAALQNDYEKAKK